MAIRLFFSFFLAGMPTFVRLHCDFLWLRAFPSSFGSHFLGSCFFSLQRGFLRCIGFFFSSYPFVLLDPTIVSGSMEYYTTINMTNL